jgi:hypothetical protein
MLGALVAATITAIGADVQAQGRPQIILFQNDNYRGNQWPVDGPVEKLRFDDRTSSVRVTGTWELCEDDNFRGRCIIVNQDVPKLDRLGFDDRLSSLRPVNGRPDDRRGGFNDRGRGEDRSARGGNGIRVVSGTYGGGTCRQPRGNRTAELAAACDGSDRCSYSINARVIGDPAFGCAKDYVAEYTCGADRSIRQSRVSPEADGQSVILECR